jgi:hypothetical protein
MRTDNKKHENAQLRREQLKKLSNDLKLANALLIANGEKINNLLVEYYRQKFEVTELKTYEQWKNFGFQVKRGSLSYMVWGTPKTIKIKNDADPTADPKEKDDFFPVCHLFDAKQVAPIETKEN